MAERSIRRLQFANSFAFLFDTPHYNFPVSADKEKQVIDEEKNPLPKTIKIV